MKIFKIGDLMFTFKKIALMGAASLAAFAMSCSDPDDASGAFDPDVSLGLESDGYVIIKEGKIISNEGVQVKSIKVTADGKSGVTLNPAPAVPASTVDLKNVNVLGICEATGANTKKSFKINISATFDDDTSIETEKSIEVTCGGGSSDITLTKKSITLSNAGESYTDLDSYTTMKEATAKTKLSDIDLVAFCGASIGCDGNKIYTPFDIDIFYDNNENYLGGNVFLFGLGSADVTTIKNATKLSQIADFLSRFSDSVEDETAEDLDDVTISGSGTTGFMVLTTAGNLRAVIISSSGTQTVDLSVTQTGLK